MPARTPKSYFSESEAAKSLGINIDEFRLLLKRYIIDCEEDLHNVAVTTFHASDLLILKLMMGRKLSATAPN